MLDFLKPLVVYHLGSDNEIEASSDCTTFSHSLTGFQSLDGLSETHLVTHDTSMWVHGSDEVHLRGSDILMWAKWNAQSLRYLAGGDLMDCVLKFLSGRCHRNAVCDTYNALIPLSSQILPYQDPLPADDEFCLCGNLIELFLDSSSLVGGGRRWGSTRVHILGSRTSIFIDETCSFGEMRIYLLLEAREFGCKLICRRCVLRIARCGRAADSLREFREVDHGGGNGEVEWCCGGGSGEAEWCCGGITAAQVKVGGKVPVPQVKATRSDRR
jgi:hypothetical protein